MSDFNRSSRDLIEKINRYIQADGQSFLSTETVNFINDEYVKERERISYYAVKNVEELHFHNLTTVFNLEKLWDILHKQYVVRKGRKPKVSPIDEEVLNTLKCSINNIIEGEKQRCPDIFAFGEPAPTPDFTIGGYKIPDNITFEGVKRGRKPAALDNYSFIVSYHASKLDPMGPIESNNVVIESDPKSDSGSVIVVVDSGLKPDDIIVKSDLGSDNVIIESGSEPVNVVDKSDLGSVNIVKIDSPQNESINKINKYSGESILRNDEWCNLGYHIDVLRKKPVTNVKSTRAAVPLPTIVHVPEVVVYTTKKIEVNRCIFEPAKYSFNTFKKPSPISSSLKQSPIAIKSSIPLYNIPLVNLAPQRTPTKLQINPGRPEGSTNKTAEEKRKIEENKLPVGRQRGSENIGATAKKDKEVIIWDNEIMLRVNPNLFEVHMIKYTIDNAEKSYAQWIEHAYEIINCLNDENKRISESAVKDWEKIVLSAIEEITSKLDKPKESESRRDRIKKKYMRMRSSAQDEQFDDNFNLKNSRYIDTESDKVKTAVDEMHMLLRSFKNNSMISDILRNALTQMNALDESKLEVALDTDVQVIPVSEIGEECNIDEVSVFSESSVDDISEISSEVDNDVSEENVNNVDVLIDDKQDIDSTSDNSNVDDIKHDLDCLSDSNSSLNCPYGTIDQNDDIDVISDIIDIYVQYDNNLESVTTLNTENIINDNILTNIHEVEIINILMEKDENDDYDENMNNFNNFNNSSDGVNNDYQMNVSYIEVIHDLITGMHQRISTSQNELINYRENYVRINDRNKNGGTIEKNRNRYFRSTINRKQKLKHKKIRTGSFLW